MGRNILLLVFVIVLVIGVFMALGLFSDKNTSDNIENALKNGSREVLDQTVGKVELGAKRIGNEIEDGTEETASALKQGAREVDQMALDASITMAVKMKFVNDEVVAARRIDVDTRGGVVTLSGVVSSNQEADRAAALAQTARGVRKVINRLEIGSNSPKVKV